MTNWNNGSNLKFKGSIESPIATHHKKSKMYKELGMYKEPYR